jgi:hypothetical protein
MHQHISSFCFLRIPVGQKTGRRSSVIIHIYLSPPKGIPTSGTIPPEQIAVFLIDSNFSQ